MSMRYFVPDWDDRVDPRYDFRTDQHRAGRDPYRDDCYAHEIFGQIHHIRWRAPVACDLGRQ